MASLTVVFRNEHPKREEKYPSTWLLFKNKDIAEIHVRHDNRLLINKVDLEQGGSVVHMRNRANDDSVTMMKPR